MRSSTGTMTPWIYSSFLALWALVGHARATGGLQEVCSGENFRASCGAGEVIVMSSAEYGRMEAGRCGITMNVGHVGCRNDYLYLLDQKCSGRRECMFHVGDNEFYSANTACLKELRAYLRISYTCLRVEYKDRSQCLVPKRLTLSPHEGFLASHVTDETGCGTTRTPWAIEAQPGQTIDLTILDFGALSRDTSSHVRCPVTYGFVTERSLAVNETICGGTERDRHLYSSKSHSVQIQLQQKSSRRDPHPFIVRYRVVGCSDLTALPNSRYSREGLEARIDCEGSDTTWRLVCNGNTWDGVVGNCTAKMAAVLGEDEDEFAIKPLLIVAAIIGATIVIAVLIIVSGLVYIKRYRHSQESRANSMQWTLHYTPKPGQPQPIKGGTYRPMAMMQARPGTALSQAQALTMQHMQQTASRPPPKPKRPPPCSTGTGRPLQHIWEMPLPDPHAKNKPENNPTPTPITTSNSTPQPEGIYMNPQDPPECTCTTPTTPANQLSDGDLPPPPPPITDGDDISSYYAPNTGHKYYVLERQDHLQQPEP